MKKLLFLIILIIIAAALYFGDFEKQITPILNGKLQFAEELKEVKFIKEIATASQQITEKADSSRFVEDAVIYNLMGLKIPLSKEVKKEILSVEQVFHAKAGYKNISIKKKDATFFVNAEGPLLLSFEKTYDSVIKEVGNWGKTETLKLDSLLKNIARKRILSDSLLGAADIHFKQYIKETIIEIQGENNFEIKYVD